MIFHISMNTSIYLPSTAPPRKRIPSIETLITLGWHTSWGRCRLVFHSAWTRFLWMDRYTRSRPTFGVTLGQISYWDEREREQLFVWFFFSGKRKHFKVGGEKPKHKCKFCPELALLSPLDSFQNVRAGGELWKPGAFHLLKQIIGFVLIILSFFLRRSLWGRYTPR